MKNKEIWKTTHICKDYLISSYGRIYSLKTNRLLSIVNIANGYKGVMLSDPFKRV